VRDECQVNQEANHGEYVLAADGSSNATVVSVARREVAQSAGKNRGWIVISMKQDWKRLFAFDK
jgi:hypothetical protein